MLPEALCQPQAWCRLLPLRAGSRGEPVTQGAFQCAIAISLMLGQGGLDPL